MQKVHHPPLPGRAPLPYPTKLKRAVLLLPIFLVLFAWGKTQAQREEGPSIDRIKEAYNRFHFPEVVSLATQALQVEPPPSSEARVEIYTYLAFAQIALGKNEEARGAFQAALELDPTLTLDPVLVSPKIIAIFNEVRSALEAKKEKETLRPILQPPQEDRRLGGAWRSLLLPGWGQLYKGQKRKAIVIFAVQTINISTLLYAHFKMDRAHDEYLQATDPDLIESTYDRYNSYHKLRNSFLLLTGGVWIYSHIDAALIQPASEKGRGAEPEASSLMPAVTSDSFYLTFTVRF